jgi:transposase
MEIAVLGIDLGKNSCSIVGFDDGGAIVLRRRMRREGVIKLAGKLRPCVVAMRPAAGRIISAVSFGLRATRCG